MVVLREKRTGSWPGVPTRFIMRPEDRVSSSIGRADVAPDAATRAGYSNQIAQYAHILGANRGAIVYMSLAEVQWVYVN
jgi:hypothetical protein